MTWAAGVTLAIALLLHANSRVGCGRIEVERISRAGDLVAIEARLSKWGWCWKRIPPEFARSSLGRMPITWRERLPHGSRLDGEHRLPVGEFVAPIAGGTVTLEAEHMRFGVIPTRTNLATIVVPPAE